jgi:hypothetical protein
MNSKWLNSEQNNSSGVLESCLWLRKEEYNHILKEIKGKKKRTNWN